MVSYGETHSGNAGSMLGKNQKRFIGVFSRMVFRAYPDKRKTYTIPLVGEFLFVSQFPETIIQAPKKARVLLLTRGEVSVNTRYFREHLIFPRKSIHLL